MNNFKRTISYLSLFLIAMTVLFSSCTQEITFREPALQGEKDSTNFWLAFDVRAYPVEVDKTISYAIEATNGTDKIIFQLPSVNKGSYDFGRNDVRKVTFTSILGVNILEYTTGINRGNGRLKITESDMDNQTISGEFYFEAIKTNEVDTIFADTVRFRKGLFYKIPVR
ncbi:MAG: hypothetical protein H6584_08695 [Flavobacteriales bacterium]|nr:hypothetical protein [Flavobacteriales bacterium]